jgi:hypothetical protein
VDLLRITAAQIRSWTNQLAALSFAGYNVGEFKVRRDGGIQMLLTFEINVALWGMIVCAAVEAAQYFEVF